MGSCLAVHGACRIRHLQHGNGCACARGIRDYQQGRIDQPQIRIEKDSNLIGIANQGRFKFLAHECTALRIDLEYLCVSMPKRIAHVERHEGGGGFGSHQFWHGLTVALDLDGPGIVCAATYRGSH